MWMQLSCFFYQSDGLKLLLFTGQKQETQWRGLVQCQKTTAELDASLWFTWRHCSFLSGRDLWLQAPPAFPQGHQLRQTHWQLVPHKMSWSYSRVKLIRVPLLALQFSQRQGVSTRELFIPQFLLTFPFKWNWRVLWAVSRCPSLNGGERGGKQAQERTVFFS